MENKKFSRSIGGKEIIFELNNWAEQANGSVLARIGDTVVLATAVMNPQAKEGMGFFPLTVDYEEKFYAAGKILGSRFVKRETRPSEEAILTSRLIDRSIRPRFDLRMRNEVQVVATVLSIDAENDPDIATMCAVSLALSLSDIPWSGPIAGIRVGKKEGEFVINPTYPERGNSALDLVLSGTKERINMIEAGANEISEDEFLQAINFGEKFIKELIVFQEEIIKEYSNPKKEAFLLPEPKELLFLIKDFYAKIENAVYQQDKKKIKVSEKAVLDEWLARAKEKMGEDYDDQSANYIFDQAINNIIHQRIISKGQRPDGRKPDELRKLSAQVAVIPRTHGTGLFMRGETHVLSSLTLGAPGDEQIVEGMEVRTKKRFLHHYNFPPFSTGETKPMRGPGRREIGHGALAGRALLPLIPSKEDFPYTIRIVSEVLSSNGSSSMASVCGSTLALMDAGVPIPRAVAGAAMGLMLNEKGDYRVLTDIQGPEDHHGDMDFKVAGTSVGITAVQVDVKIEGITSQMIKDTLEQARSARKSIMKVMEEAIKEPRTDLSPFAPRITTLKISPEKIGTLIGPGGKTINEIIDQTGVQIDIEDDGSVFVTSENGEQMAKAVSIIKKITKEIKAGELLEGKVTRILDFGAMVEVAPRQEGLIHISELAPWRVEKVTDIVHIGDVVPVKVKEIDEQERINLSLKDVPGRYSEEDIAKGKSGAESFPGMRRPKPHIDHGADKRQRHNH